MVVETLGFRLDELEGVERYLSLPSDVAFVSGSQQVGLGNSTSDYDLYVIYRDELERLKEGPKQFWLKDPHRRVDMERHGWQAVLDAATTVNALVDPVPAGTRGIPFDAFDLYYRTAVGRPMANEAGFRELTAVLDTSRYDAAFAAWSLWQAGIELAKARQRLGEGRQEAAFFSARLGLRHAVSAQMARLGRGWPNPKWAFVKLAMHYGRDSDEYRHAWQVNGLGGRDVLAYVAGVTGYCEELGTPHLVPSPVEAAVYAWRGSATTASIAGRTYLVHGRRSVYELDEAAAFIASLVDGARTQRSICAAFGERFGLPAQVAFYRAGALLQQLHEAGALRSRDEYVLPEEAVDAGA